MSTYAIGDVQGCFSALQHLLLLIEFNPEQDVLWFVGDLVNRGPQSLEVLRFVKSLGDRHKIVLGNHDLHLLALAYGVRQAHPSDTLATILSASDKEDLINWLRHRPLLVHDENYVMTHAGLAPCWTLEQAKKLAQEVEAVLQSTEANLFLKEMYGNQPDHWQDDLSGRQRLRCITNYLTRMRLCYADGRLDLSYKGTLENKPQDLIPWYEVESRCNKELKIIFGHWAALGGKTNTPNVYALDTGCVWRNCLTAMRLTDEKRFSVKC